MAAVQRFPFSRGFQRSLMCVLYQHPEISCDVLVLVDPSNFERTDHRWVIEKLQYFRQRVGVPATRMMLETELRKDIKHKRIPSDSVEALQRCLQRLSRPVKDRDYILKEAYDFIRLGRYSEFVINSAKALNQGDVETVAQGLDAIRAIGARVDGDLGQDLIADMRQRHERRTVISTRGVPTGLPIDNDMRAGGLPPGKLGVFISPSGRGKTMLLSYVAGSGYLAGKSVLYVTCEEEKDEIYERIEARLTSVSLSDIVVKAKQVRRELRQLAQRPGIGVVKVCSYPAGTLRADQLRSLLIRFQAVSFYPDVLMIDYADEMDLSEFRGGSHENDYGPLGRLYVKLKGMAGEFKIPIWTASQTNRSGSEKENIAMGDMADSFRKAQVADFLVTLEQTKDEERSAMARLCVLKSRIGAKNLDGHVIRYDPNAMEIS